MRASLLLAPLVRRQAHGIPNLPAGGLDSSPLDDWRRQIVEPRRRPVRRWLWSIAALTLIVLVIGGITRLTHSGLSMVDWQPLVGVVPPLDEGQWERVFARYQQFPEYRQLRRSMTLAEFKVIFFWEYLHRIAARLIGLAFAVPFLWFWIRGYLTRPLALRTLLLFGLGGMQGLLGWLMVKSGLIDQPSVSHYRLAAHLTLAFVIFGYSVWLARDLAYDGSRPAIPPQDRRLLVRGLAIVGVLLAAQVIWGAFVAGLKAGLIFNTFPLMDGSLVPPRLTTLDPWLLNLVQNPIAVQWVHRLLGTALLAAVLGLFLVARRRAPDALSRRLNAVLAVLVALQYLLGVLTLLYVVPVPLGVAHQATAMVIAGVWVVWAQDVARRGEVEGREVEK